MFMWLVRVTVLRRPAYRTSAAKSPYFRGQIAVLPRPNRRTSAALTFSKTLAGRGFDGCCQAPKRFKIVNKTIKIADSRLTSHGGLIKRLPKKKRGTRYRANLFYGV